MIKKTDVKNEDPENRAYRKYFTTASRITLGWMCTTWARTEPIKAGMLFTVEPGIYIEEEQMGMRIENNIWITKNGNKDLMSRNSDYRRGDRKNHEKLANLLISWSAN